MDKAWDRLLEARRRRSFDEAPVPPPGFSSPILNLAASAPAPRLGGVEAQLLWRLTEEAKRRPVALLYPVAAAKPETEIARPGFRLELQDDRQRRVLSLPPRTVTPGATTWQTQPATSLIDPHLEDAVVWAAGLCGATTVHVEGLARMPLGSLLRLRRGTGLRLIVSLHDFAAFCPRPHLLESVPPPAPPGFCHYSRDRQRCALCLGRQAGALPPGYQAERRELARELLLEADALVYPSSFLARAHHQLFAGAGAAAACVIAPAAPPSVAAPTACCLPVSPTAPTSAAGVKEPASPSYFPTAAASGAARPARRPLHIAWVGAVHPHKGALVFEAAVEHLAAAGGRPRLTAYGGGDPEILARWRRLPGLRVRGYYRAGSLPALLRRDQVDLALLLSVVPESYGLVLDECAAAGVPVAAFDLGAPAERLAAGTGLLLDAHLAGDPTLAGAALGKLLGDLMDGSQAMPPPPKPPGAARHPAVTAAAWLDLYRELRLLPPAFERHDPT